MERWVSYDIDRVRGTFGVRGLSISEWNHVSVKSFVLNNTEGIHGSMQQLMKWQNILMIHNNEIIVK